MKHIGIVDITTIGACLCANTIVAKAAELDPSGAHPEFTLHAFSFKKYIDPINQQKWDFVANIILQSIDKLKLAGADFIIIPSNTPHFAIETIMKKSPLLVLNLLEIVADECVRLGFKQVAVLGTKFTMLSGLYTNVLQDRNIMPVIPHRNDCDKIHSLIIDEIIPSKIKPESVNAVADIIKELPCQAAILACTELPAVYNEQNLGMPVIDTTRLIAHKALEYALQP